ncbi:MAG: hypothetical protein AAFZ15_33820 [Bacteroidota bacterium]
MKNNLLFALLISLMFLSACSNDFDVTAPWKDIPVVYGLLDSDSDVHYIRVEKAFLDPERNALEDAQIADSLYYENATVQLERVSTNQIFTMTRVDGNNPDYDIEREQGVFATAPNYLYRLPNSEIDLEQGETIRFILDRGGEKPLVTAETVIQGEMRKRTPNGTNLDFVPNITEDIGWSASSEAKIFDVSLIINYAEFPKDNPDLFEEKSFEWVWAKGLTFIDFQNEYRVTKDGAEFYNVMAATLADDPNVERIFNNIDIRVVSGGEALEKYINVALANTGITGSQELPSFSNLSEGMGVFSTKGNLRFNGLTLSSRTRDSLANGSITRHLNFQ